MDDPSASDAARSEDWGEADRWLGSGPAPICGKRIVWMGDAYVDAPDDPLDLLTREPQRGMSA